MSWHGRRQSTCHSGQHRARAVILWTWLIPKQGGGSIPGLLCAPRPVNIISLDFVQFNFRLLSSAQVWTCDSSRSQVDELAAGTITKVLSENLTSTFPWCTAVYKMTYTVSSGTLNPSIPYHTIPYLDVRLKIRRCDDEWRRTEGRALNYTSKNVRKVGNTVHKFGAVWVSAEKVIDPIINRIVSISVVCLTMSKAWRNPRQTHRRMDAWSTW